MKLCLIRLKHNKRIMIITLCFLSGDLQELQVGEDISLVYNVKALISDEFYLKDNMEIDTDLIHLYEYDEHNEHNEHNEYNELDDNQSVVDGKMYRVIINTLTRYLIYLNNDIVYRQEIGNENKSNLSDYELSEVCQTKTAHYFFDLKSFQKSWFNGESFFERFGFELREDGDDEGLYPSENEWDMDDEWEADDSRVKWRTLECLRKIFRRIENLTLLEEYKL